MIGFVINSEEEKISAGLKNNVRKYDFINSEFTTLGFNLSDNGFVSTHKRADQSFINVYNLLFSFSDVIETYSEEEE